MWSATVSALVGGGDITMVTCAAACVDGEQNRGRDPAVDDYARRPRRRTIVTPFRKAITYLTGTRLVINSAHRFVSPFLPTIARGLGISWNKPVSCSRRANSPLSAHH